MSRLLRPAGKDSAMLNRERSRPPSKNGIVLWEGNSLLDGGPVVAIATGVLTRTANRKTGPMQQVWILRADVPPVDAARTGDDRSVCGDCKLRQSGCYVILHRGPTAVYSAYKNGQYETVEQLGWSWADSRSIRFGAYGDPAAVPAWIWFKLAARAARWTGYTHHWKLESAQPLRFLLMASVDTPEEAWKARATGWRTYRLRLPNEPLHPGESRCPAAAEAGKRTTCDRCAQCDGARPFDLRRHYAVIAHGARAGLFTKTRLRVL